ncbi:MAG TPA: DUF2231 domain-containing protein [Thermoanaerobaculia bacterium]|nr:DUF2231 domain-containing protein [Thermoanaerobaculia bacterium]
MESRAKLFGHPIHQMLIVFPLGLLATSLFFDVIALATDNSGLLHASWYMIAAGVLSGLVAAVFGAIDYFAIPQGTRAKRIGTMHGAGNVVVIVLFAASWLLRRQSPADPGMFAIALSALGATLGGVTGWLGGELVDRLGVGVDDGANLDAPSSLSVESPARERT